MLHTRLLALALATCAACSDPQEWSVLLGGLSLPSGSMSDVVDKDLVFFVGASDSFRLTLRLNRVTPGARVTALSGSGAVVAAYPDDFDDPVDTEGIVEIDFPGNVGILHFETDGVADAPLASADEVVIRPLAALVPEPETDLADSVASMPVTLGQPVELFFPATRMRYFFTLNDVGGKTIDLVLDGPGTVDTFAGDVYISSPTAGFLIGPEEASEPDETGTGFYRVSVPPEQDTLLLTVESIGASGHGRFTVLEPDTDGLLSVSMRVLPGFVDMDPVAAMTAALDRINQSLYRVTAGQVRIANATFRTGLVNPLDLSDDLYLLPPAGVPATEFLEDRITFSLPAPPAEIDADAVARLVLHAKLDVPLEVAPSGESGEVACPASLMSGGSFSRLCWGENHDPFDSDGLDMESSWEHLAEALGIDPPERSPADVLRFVSTVVPPVTVAVQP